MAWYFKYILEQIYEKLEIYTKIDYNNYYVKKRENLNIGGYYGL